MSNTKIIMAVPPRYVVRVSNLVWFYEGHKVVVIIAANGLTANARSHVAQIERRSGRCAFGGKGDGCGIDPAGHRGLGEGLCAEILTLAGIL